VRADRAGRDRGDRAGGDVGVGALDELRVRATAAERAAGTLSASTDAEARRIFAEQGCVILEGLLDEALVDAVRRCFDDHDGALGLDALQSQCDRGGACRYLQVGDRRYDISPRMVGALGDPQVFANPLALQLLRGWLGHDLQLSSFNIVVSYPGAAMQHIHRDHAHLFEDHPDEVSTALPPHAVNMVVPLVDVDVETGPTAIFPGSHRWPADGRSDPADLVPVPLARGDCMFADYRTLHAGMPNRSQRVRPVLYVTYSRAWFFDEVNFTARNPTDIVPGRYDDAPALHTLLRRALTRQLLSART
jgi:ectoine hydroxylase-related dioxygenase (phytanoyl-CoA dioxygenase family)